MLMQNQLAFEEQEAAARDSKEMALLANIKFPAPEPESLHLTKARVEGIIRDLEHTRKSYERFRDIQLAKQ